MCQIETGKTKNQRRSQTAIGQKEAKPAQNSDININNFNLNFRNIQLQEQYLIKISSKNNMHHKSFQSVSPQNTSITTNFSLFQPLKPSTLPSFQQTIIPSDHDQHLSATQQVQQNGHSAFCHQAHLQVQRQNYSQAFETCIKAIQEPSKCSKCLNLYLQLYEITLPRRLPLLDILLQRCQKGLVQDLQIYVSLKKIKEAQNFDQVYLDLLTDLEQGGAEFSHISLLSQNQDNRTIVARTDIEKDSTILFIPKNKLILLENARESQIVKKVRHQRLYLRSPKHCQLTIFLLEQAEKGEHSAFWFYIRHLPQNFETFPINFKPIELNYLKGSPFLQQVETKITDMKSDYESICNVCSEFQRFSYDDFKKFRLIVSSRLFGINIGQLRTDALVPLADMLNHNIPKQTSWYYSVPHDGFMIKSTKKIDKGEQIYDSYGLKCNSRFLLNYGFTMPQNDMNQATIKIPFEYEEDDRTEIYRQVTLKVTTNIESKQFEELLSILRHSIIQQYEDNREIVSIEKVKQTQFVSIDNEAQIWQKFEKIVESQLLGYPTTLKEDVKLLMSKDLSINYVNCLILRKGQKQIYQFYLTMARKMIKYFRSAMGRKALDQLQDYESYLKKLNFS